MKFSKMALGALLRLPKANAKAKAKAKAKATGQLATQPRCDCVRGFAS
jgi:hypothetical protein